MVTERYRSPVRELPPTLNAGKQSYKCLANAPVDHVVETRTPRRFPFKDIEALCRGCIKPQVPYRAANRDVEVGMPWYTGYGPHGQLPQFLAAWIRLPASWPGMPVGRGPSSPGPQRGIVSTVGLAGAAFSTHPPGLRAVTPPRGKNTLGYGPSLNHGPSIGRIPWLGACGLRSGTMHTAL